MKLWVGLLGVALLAVAAGACIIFTGFANPQARARSATHLASLASPQSPLGFSLKDIFKSQSDDEIILPHDYTKAENILRDKWSKTHIDPALLNKNSCGGKVMSDKDWLKELLRLGDARAAAIIANDKSSTQPDDAHELYTYAANRGILDSQKQLCKAYTSANDQKRRVEDLKWCREIAETGYTTRPLADIYFKGIGTKQDYKKALLWSSLEHDKYNRDYHAMAEARKNLSESDLKQIDEQVQAWRPKQSTTVSSLELPLNEEGILCGGVSYSCKATDVCENLISVVCFSKRYFFADASSGKPVTKYFSFEDNVQYPKTWTCGDAKNLPPIKASQPKEKNLVVTCNKVNFLHKNYSFNFVDQETGKILSTCNQSCIIPDKWSCGLPSIYFPCVEECL